MQGLATHFKKCTTNKRCKLCGCMINNLQTFCSRTCSAKWNNKNRNDRGWTMSVESRCKLSDTTTGRTNPHKGIKTGPRILHSVVSFCRNCGTLIKHSRRKSCSDECLKELLRLGGCKAASNKITRSKQEIELFDLCTTYFTNITHNHQIISGWDADIILNNEKIAVLWNGPWHYKHMTGLKHSLSQVQNRDKIKTRALESIGWIVIVYRDDEYTPTTAFENLKMRALDSHQD